MYQILIVDDVKLNRQLFRAGLNELESITFLEAANGVEALQIIHEQSVDLIILDLMMPGMDGYQVLTELKSQEQFRSIPVIVCSAMDKIDYIARALDLGAYDYFTKPLTPEQLKVTLPMKVRNALESYSQRTELVRVHEKMQTDLMMASIFQTSLMAGLKEFSSVTMYGQYLPCNEIGGDLFDCVEYDGKVWFIIAEASGDGVVAAMMSTMIKNEFTHCIEEHTSPKDVLGKLNQVFYNIAAGNYYFTAFVGLIDHHTLTWSNGGHIDPLYFSRKNNSVQFLVQESLTVGQCPEATYVDDHMSFDDGDVVMAYTSGLLSDRVFGGERHSAYRDLERYFMDYRQLITEDHQEFFKTMLNLFGNTPNRIACDDIAMMVVAGKA